MRIDPDRKRASPAVRVIRALALGWLVYMAVFFLLARFAPGYDISFLHPASQRYTDFFEVNYWAARGDAYLVGCCSNYPPLAQVFAKFFALFTPATLGQGTVPTRDSAAGHVLYACFALLVTAASVLLLRRLLRRMPETERSVHAPLFFALVLCGGFSFLFALDRGNYILLSFLFFLGFLVLYDKNETASGILLALCACTKVYPVLFFLLFLFDKKYKGFLAGMAAGVVGLFLPMLFLHGSPAAQLAGFLSGVLHFNATDADSFSHLEQHSNSFSNLFRWIALLAARGGAGAGAVRALEVICGVGTVLLLLVTVVTFFFAHRRWQRVFLAAAAGCLFPNNTYDYMLLFFLPVIALLLAEGRQEDGKYAVLLALLACVPKCYCFFPPETGGGSIQCILNPLLLTVTIALLFVENVLPRLQNLRGCGDATL